MTDPGTPGIFRWVNGRYVFVPARRPEIGEACLLYPVRGGYLAVPLDRPNVADPVIIEPVGGRYVAVPFVAPGCTDPTASFTWAVDGGGSLTITDTTTGSCSGIFVGVYADFGLPTYREIYYGYHAKGDVISGLDCSDPGAYYCQLSAVSACPNGTDGYVSADLFTVEPETPVTVPPTVIADGATALENLYFPTVTGTYVGWSGYTTHDFFVIDTASEASWTHTDATSFFGDLGDEHYAGYVVGSSVVIQNLQAPAGSDTRTIFTSSAPGDGAPENVSIADGYIAFMVPNTVTGRPTPYLCTIDDWGDPSWVVNSLFNHLTMGPCMVHMAGGYIVYSPVFPGLVTIVRLVNGNGIVDAQIPVPISAGAVCFMGPRTNGEVVVWSDNRGVVLYDITAETTMVLAADGREPDIDGDNIVYILAGDVDVMKVYNCATGVTTDIRTAYYMKYPAIDGTTIAWSEMAETDDWFSVWYLTGW